VWTLDQQAAYAKQGQWPTQGNIDPNLFIENLFSTYVYSGNGSTQTITNGINLSANAGLVWLKGRNIGSNNVFLDTIRGVNSSISSNNTDGAINPAGGYVSAFNTNGFSLGSNITANGSTYTYASWTFREQPKFFDVLTYTGTGAVQNIAHNLGSVPGCIIVKKISGDGDDWGVYHRSLGATYKINLNNTDVPALSTGYWNNTEPTSSVFTVATSGITNQSGATYVAYLFAHNAGGFGTSGSENVITCGSFVQSGDTTITLGYEPQWVLIKQTNAGGDNWKIWDTMRGWSHSTYGELYPNTSAGEPSGNGNYSFPTATGFVVKSGWLTNGTYIYMAIRRGPMAVPTLGTNVFSPVARVGTGTITTVTAGFNPDLAISAKRTSGEYMPLVDKLRGTPPALFWQQGKTDAENTSYATQWFTAFTNTGVIVGPDTGGGQAVNASGQSFIQYYFQRAPNFFDIVCYTGTGGATTQTHNLGVVPELIVVKSRSASGSWAVYSAALGNTGIMFLDTTAANAGPDTQWNSTTPTSTVFSIGSSSEVNFSGRTYVAYLFATCPGVSKVGSYTGTGTLTTINCGFTGGARYVFIKRTNGVSNWVMWDTSRGMVAGTDPSISSNYQGAEINGNSVYTITTGFQLLASPVEDVNTAGGNYIFLAIA
jgi:hypothetical protein